MSNPSSRNQDPAPRLHHCFSASPWFLHPLPSLMSTGWNLPFGTQFSGAQLSLWSNSHKGWASLIAQLVRNLLAVQEAQVRVPEKGKATHSGILGLPLWLSWERIHLKCSRPGFDPWVGENPPALEKENATSSSILAWRIPRTVLSTGSQRVGHD